MQLELATGETGSSAGLAVKFVGGGHLTLPDGRHVQTVELRFTRDGREETVHVFEESFARPQATLGAVWKVVRTDGGPSPTAVVLDLEPS